MLDVTIIYDFFLNKDFSKNIKINQNSVAAVLCSPKGFGPGPHWGLKFKEAQNIPFITPPPPHPRSEITETPQLRRK